MHAQDIANSWQAWLKAATSSTIDDALRDMYQRVDDAIAARGPTCWISGRCCNFNAYGHRMYVTGVEIVWVLKKATEPSSHKATRGLKVDDVDLQGACVFQINGMCSIHDIRPLGCRVFFCQEGTQGWQQELYEDFQRELRLLHDNHHLPYQYMEWRAGLKECLEYLNG